MDDLVAVLDRSRALGHLGPGPVDVHVEHAHGFVAALADQVDEHTRAIDLGSGGGVPGLVLAVGHPGWSMTLLDSRAQRCAFLVDAVAGLGLGDRVEVRCVRAEVAGREPTLRGGFDLVVARGFGPPMATAECAAPFLRVGGRLVVSDPPDAEPGVRWPSGPLGQLGMEVEAHRDVFVGHFTVLRQASACPDRFPRRVGIPRKRPLS